ncbi:hypothetical protein AA0113_g5185 [Alternaria arborescens]|uniref:Uncharacterized protein n=1 Tax=Alternaria arborescens TaxID=156630 RepID=A0A4Q4S5V3_9PLEO|nr:hypothetical protein AA0113_g5185 [Alternaria arborescens]
MFLPTALLALIHLALPALSHASPQPALISSDWEMSLVPRHQLFLRQLSNLQTFDGNLGGTRASAITNSGDKERPFQVDGDTFTSFDTAAQRSCDNQFKGCSDTANKSGGGGDKGKKGKKGKKRQDGSGLSVNDCDEQKNKCNDAQKNAQVKDFNSAVASTNIGPDPDFPDFDLICEG